MVDFASNTPEATGLKAKRGSAVNHMILGTCPGNSLFGTLSNMSLWSTENRRNGILHAGMYRGKGPRRYVVVVTADLVLPVSTIYQDILGSSLWRICI
jgi:hypothetical protein